MFKQLNTFIRGLFSSNKKGAAARPAAVPAEVVAEVSFLHPSGKARQRERVRHSFPATPIEEKRETIKQAAPKMSVREWIKSVNEYDSIRSKIAI